VTGWPPIPAQSLLVYFVLPMGRRRCHRAASTESARASNPSIKIAFEEVAATWGY
jgi:hypothetical protein